LDELIAGGFPRNRTILVRGECGTGKTIFGCQFLHNGIVKHDEPGILVLLEQNPDEFRDDMTTLGFDIKKLEGAKKFVLIDVSLSRLNFGEQFVNIPVSTESFSLLPGETTLDKLVNVIIEVARKIGAKRVVVDSLPALDILAEREKDARRLLLSMSYKIKEAGLTAILISEDGIDSSNVKADIEKYVVDGVISLKYNVSGPDAGRKLVIDKMRKTSHSEAIHPLRFVVDMGIEILKE